MKCTQGERSAGRGENDGLAEKVRRRDIPLNLYFGIFKKPDKTNFDLRELSNLGPNEIFSNVGSLIMKNGLRPLIVYRLS